MTHTDYIKIILNIKDNNINFYENCLEIKKINNCQTKIFRGYITYIPECCPKCGYVNDRYNDIIKWNWKRNCKIKMTKAWGYNALLILDK